MHNTYMIAIFTFCIKEGIIDRRELEPMRFGELFLCALSTTLIKNYCSHKKMSTALIKKYLKAEYIFIFSDLIFSYCN